MGAEVYTLFARLPSELMTLGQAVKAMEGPKAKERKGTRTDLEPAGNFPAGSADDTGDKVGEVLGGRLRRIGGLS